MESPRKIESQQLEVSEDGYGDILYQGSVFTGIAYEFDPKTGTLIGLSGYSLGRPHGPSRTWSPSGQLQYEHYYDQGGNHGPFNEWYKNGKVKIQSYWECNILVYRKNWTEDGTLIEDRIIKPGSASFNDLNDKRSRASRPIIDIDLETWEFVERPEGWRR